MCVLGRPVPVDGETTVFEQLMAVILDRKQNLPAKSYTTQLLNGGASKIAAKILEEAAEVVEAAADTDMNSRSHLVHETADLIYHLWVMLALREISLSEIEGEIVRRFGVSGLDEKASRTTS